MKKILISIICCLTFSLAVHAQASGGQITRKTRSSNVQGNRQHHKKNKQPANSVKLDDGTVIIYETSKDVDLGLPSGTIWAGWNIGASSPLSIGDYFAWGETETKSNYDWGDYFDINTVQKDIYGKYTKPCFKDYHVDAKLSIVGTNRDAAYVKWGYPWQMPTKEQLEELVKECRINQVSLPGNKWFVVFTGPNGKSIIFPTTGEKYKTEIGNNYFNGTLIWSGELRPFAEASTQNSEFAYHLGSRRVFAEGFRCYGMNIRAVRSR